MGVTPPTVGLFAEQVDERIGDPVVGIHRVVESQEGGPSRYEFDGRQIGIPDARRDQAMLRFRKHAEHGRDVLLGGQKPRGDFVQHVSVHVPLGFTEQNEFTGPGQVGIRVGGVRGDPA